MHVLIDPALAVISHGAGEIHHSDVYHQEHFEQSDDRDFGCRFGRLCEHHSERHFGQLKTRVFECHFGRLCDHYFG